jgi:hypothetical protein
MSYYDNEVEEKFKKKIEDTKEEFLDIEDDFEEYVEINAKLYSLCFKR